ncbi:MAG TPA: glycosyltransferase family 2 protein [Terriglobia bacterium]|nr:glycosyltransferase family 2 protein [Terriglobia bacterium]
MPNDRDPGVSAIIPARNEAAVIARAVESLERQPDIREIIVVDDQSEDQTPEILARLARQYSNLRMLRLENLPSGWLGKPHALAEGVKLATGDWLLFTDADTEHKPGSLASLLDRAEAEHAGFVSISPGQHMKTWWERAVIPLVYVQLARLYRFEDVSDPRSPAAAANGQYLLIRRGIYESIGGHEAVRNAVLEDVELAKRVKAAGVQIWFLPGAAWAETRMYQAFGDMWRGWTKNLFLLYGRSSGRVVKALFDLFLDWAPGALLIIFPLALLLGPWQSWLIYATAAAIVVFWMQQWSYKRRLERLGFSRGLANYFLLGAPLFGLLLLNSLRTYRLGGAVEWKGRTYSVKETS